MIRNKKSTEKSKLSSQYIEKLVKFCITGADWNNLSKILEVAVGKVVLDSAKQAVLAKEGKQRKVPRHNEKENTIFSLANISSVFCMGKKISSTT